MNERPKRQNSKVKKHKHSNLLSPDENNSILSLIEPKCLSLFTGVAQFYTSNPPTHANWIKHCAGVLCFIKNNQKRSYFFRLYCTKQYKLVWEQEMYLSMEIYKSRPYLITFEGENGLVALNFSSAIEAEELYKIPAEMNLRRRKLNNEGIIVRQSVQVQEEESVVALRKPVTVNQDQHNFALEFGANRKLVKKKGGVQKLQISEPLNFEHVVHVGFSKEKGFDGHGHADVIKQFLCKAGVTNHELEDRKTVAFIEDFLEKNNVLEKIQDKPQVQVQTKTNHIRQIRKQSRAQNITLEKSTKKPTHPPTVPHRSPKMPTIPAPILNNNKPTKIENGPQPPPLPPMAPPMPIYQIPETVDVKTSDTNLDSRSDLMSSIRKGATLKKVTEDSQQQTISNEDNPAKSSNMSGTDALANALRRALQDRGRVVRSSSEDSDSTENDGEWD